MKSRRPGRSRRTRIDGQFAAREIRMLESAPFRVLSLSARRALDRLEIELAHHGGMDNGRLPTTYDDFQRYGIDRHSIGAALRELEALGFIEITQRGRAGNAQWRTPNRFRLTYKATKDADATHEWKRIQTMDRATVTAEQARKPVPARPRAARSANKTPVGKNTNTSVGTPHLVPVRKSPTTGHGANPPLLSISRGGGLGWRPKSKRVRPRLRAPHTP
jgi:hypothetical protein